MQIQSRHRVASILLVMVIAMTMMFTVQTRSASAKTAYWLKVNTQRCVVTAYKKTGGTWKPVRAMLCSPGKSGTSTVHGTFRIGIKKRWGALNGRLWGQYTSQITRDYLFHSVWYTARSRSAQSAKEFNKLGHPASHGCVRLSTIDAKWIYDNCARGTKVTVYRSSKAGPLGKPKAIKSHSGWDPTDPAKGNPSFKLKKAVITIKKSKQVEYGTAIRLKQGVTAKNPNANESLTSRIQVAAVQYCNTKTGKYVKKAFSSRRTGKWRVTYRVTYPYCRSAKKTFTFKVADTSKPVLKHAKKRTLTVGEADAVRNVAAATKTKDLTKSMQVSITAPDGTKTTLTYKKAKKYIFRQAGIYTVKYAVTNPVSGRRAVKKVRFTVNEVVVDPATPEAPDQNTTQEETTSEQ